MPTETVSGEWSLDTLRIHFANLIRDSNEHQNAMRAALAEQIANRMDGMDRELSTRVQNAGELRAAIASQIATRLDDMDRAAIVLAETVNRVPTVLDREMTRQAQLLTQKFDSIQTQFSERDARVTQERAAANAAVQAALQAQKETVAAQSASSTKQIDALGALAQADARSMNDKIAGLASRLDRGEGGNQRSNSNLTFAIAAAGVLISLAGVLFAILHSAPSP